MEEKIPNNIEGEAIYIELVWDSIQDLIDLQSSEHFTNFILLKSYDAVTKAIKDNSDKVELFNIFNMSLIVELEKKNYPLVLNKLIEYFVSIEDYEECGKIKTLINKI